MEAPLHHSPVPLPVPAAPPRPHDAAVLQQAAMMMMMAQNPPPPPPPPPPAMMGREQCPRCASRDTKFCYYNNYNTAQPRHFCRACRRYWTLGGSLRNVPVGGSTRKRLRPSSARWRGPTRAAALAAMTASSSSSAATAATTTTASSCGGPCFAAASSPAVAPAPAQSAGGGLLSSLLLGSVPLLEGRLGLGSDIDLGSMAGDLAQLGFGAGPLLWPAATVLEGDRAADSTTWKSGGALFPPAAAMWQELDAAVPATGAGAPQLLL